jgi:hypothetical protein
MSVWSSFPRRRVLERLPLLTAGVHAGSHMAALRVYFALAIEADYHQRTVAMSLTQLERSTGLSRPMVAKGLGAAVDVGLLAVDDSSYRHSYRQLADDGDVSFAKIPKARLSAALPQLPTRGFHALDCLKIYAALLVVRPRLSFQVPISHKRLVSRTRVQPRRIRAGIDVLANHRLIHVASVASGSSGRTHNVYDLLGFKSIEAEEDAMDSEEAIDADIDFKGWPTAAADIDLPF